MSEIKHMQITSKIKRGINRLLSPIGLHVGSTKKRKNEIRRLKRLQQDGYFSGPVFPVPDSFRRMEWKEVVRAVREYRKDLSRLESPATNDVNYTFDNGWYYPPDAEVLYTIVRRCKPERILEVGSGNSTRLFRQASIDGDINAEITSVDPNPRAEIRNISDEIHRTRVEEIENTSCFEKLESGDILFIDSSHQIKTGNDVVFLYLNVIPLLDKGVIIHIHDVFLPFEYPAWWKIEQEWKWNEQYLVQALLHYGQAFEVLWAGCYVQRCMLDETFLDHFPRAEGRVGQSLWLRKQRKSVRED